MPTCRHSSAVLQYIYQPASAVLILPLAVLNLPGRGAQSWAEYSATFAIVVLISTSVCLASAREPTDEFDTYAISSNYGWHVSKKAGPELILKAGIFAWECSQVNTINRIQAINQESGSSADDANTDGVQPAPHRKLLAPGQKQHDHDTYYPEHGRL